MLQCHRYSNPFEHNIPGLDNPAVLVWIESRQRQVHVVLALPLNWPTVRASVSVRVARPTSAHPSTTIAVAATTRPGIITVATSSPASTVAPRTTVVVATAA